MTQLSLCPAQTLRVSKQPLPETQPCAPTNPTCQGLGGKLSAGKLSEEAAATVLPKLPMCWGEEEHGWAPSCSW